jgi:tetratricopeptide (TPR) repeat protein
MTRTIIETLRQNLRQALQRHDLAEAELVLAHLKKEDPLGPQTRGFELELYLESNRLPEASILADQLCRAFPDSARIHFLAGKLEYRRKHYEAAEGHLRESQRIYPSPQTQYWLGKTLTQNGRFDEAEALLLSVRERNPWAWLALAWLYERKNDFEAALKACETFLEIHPGHPSAAEQRARIRAKKLDPEALIEEAEALADFGEAVPEAVFPEFVQRLFETGQAPRAREEITTHLQSLEPRDCVRLAWVCYHFQAYDLACTLFLAQLKANLANFKYLAALEAAARKCGRLSQVLEAYRPLCPEARHLYGRCRLLSRRES